MSAEPVPPASSPPPASSAGPDVLQLLSLLHTALGILIVMLALVPAIVLGVGLELGSAGGDEMVRTEGGRATEALSRAFVVAVITGGIATAAIVLWGARALMTRKGWSRAVASTVVLCFFFPLGTLLGGYTLSRLFDPATRASFR